MSGLLDVLRDFGPELLGGFGVTVRIVIASLVVAIVAGTIVAARSTSSCSATSRCSS